MLGTKETLRRIILGVESVHGLLEKKDTHIKEQLTEINKRLVSVEINPESILEAMDVRNKNFALSEYLPSDLINELDSRFINGNARVGFHLTREANSLYEGLEDLRATEFFKRFEAIVREEYEMELAQKLKFTQK